MNDWTQPDTRARYCGFRDAVDMAKATGVTLSALLRSDPQEEPDDTWDPTVAYATGYSP